MPDEDALHALIRLLYECAVDPSQWPVFLAGYAKLVGAHAAGLVVQDVRNHRGNVSAGHGFDPFWERRYAEYYAGINVWAQSAGHLWRPGKLFASDDYVSDASLVRTEFYADFLRPQQHFYSFGGIVTRENSVTSYVTALRSKRAGKFTQSEYSLALRLMPHFETALRVHQRIAGLETRLDQSSGVLDQASHGVIVTNGAGTVLFMNRLAEEMLGLRGTAGSGGLAITKNGLCARLPAETARLRELIARSAETTAANGTHAGGAMSISRFHAPPLKVLVAPLSSAKAARGPCAVLFVSVPEQMSAPGADLLEQLFNLTPTEARLAAALVEGKTLHEFAAESGVSFNTARTHLRRVFDKTGATRQAELVRLVMGAAGTWLGS